MLRVPYKGGLLAACDCEHGQQNDRGSVLVVAAYWINSMYTIRAQMGPPTRISEMLRSDQLHSRFLTHVILFVFFGKEIKG